MSKAVIPPQVSIVALPDTAGVHSKTASGEARVGPFSQSSELNSLEPEVSPSNCPPAGGMTVRRGGSHAPGTVDVVVELLVEVVVELLVEDVLVVVVNAPGGRTSSIKSPAAPFHPSTMMV